MFENVATGSFDHADATGRHVSPLEFVLMANPFASVPISMNSIKFKLS
jgi:hypothetical protein